MLPATRRARALVREWDPTIVHAVTPLLAYVANRDWADVVDRLLESYALALGAALPATTGAMTGARLGAGDRVVTHASTARRIR